MGSSPPFTASRETLLAAFSSPLDSEPPKPPHSDPPPYNVAGRRSRHLAWSTLVPSRGPGSKRVKRPPDLTRRPLVGDRTAHRYRRRTAQRGALCGRARPAAL